MTRKYLKLVLLGIGVFLVPTLIGAALGEVAALSQPDQTHCLAIGILLGAAVGIFGAAAVTSMAAGEL